MEYQAEPQTFTVRPGISDEVAQFYRRFPYPRLSVLRQIHPGHFSVARLNYVLGRRRQHRLPERLKIWIPGAGTTLALQTALNFPQASVLATDLSSQSLAIARALAGELGLTNITFEVQDLLQANYHEQFDFIDCAGVLNHVADPVRGMQVIRQSLTANGAASIFVYNSHHRWLSDAWQQAVAVLSNGSTSMDVRLDIATRLYRAARKSKRLQSIQAPLDVVEQESDLSAFADTLLHPNEVSFSIDQVHDLVAAGGLKMAAWRDPQDWNIAHYLDNPTELAGRKLSDIDSNRLVWALTREDSPLFDFYVVRSEFEGGRPFSAAELLRRKLVAYSGATYYTIREGRLHSQWHCDAMREAGDRFEVMLNEDTREKSQRWRPLTLAQADVLRQAQQGTSVQDLLNSGSRLGQAAMVKLVAELIAPRAGVLA